jgi:hypothetical protein
MRIGVGGLGMAEDGWPEGPPLTPQERHEIVAAVDWFGEALSEKGDIAEDLVDPRYPLLPAQKDWCGVVDNASWNNRDWALGLWHVILGQLLREQKVWIGNRWLDGRFHLLILAPSSSGKTLAADQARRILEHIQRFDKGMAVAPFEVRPVIEATTAALVGSAQQRKVKGGVERVVVPGLLDKADILHWDEAEAIFHETSYNANLLRVLNQAMNPIGSPGNVVGKELAGVTNTVQPKCSLLLTAVDFLAIPEPILRCGFYQRIGVMRKVLTTEQRRANRLREKQLMDAGEKARTGAESLRVEEYLNKLAGVYSHDFKWDFRRVTGMVQGKYVKMLEAAGKQEAVRPYLEDFAERYTDKLYILAMHNCAVRTIDAPILDRARVIEPEDVGRAWVVVKTCMRQFFHYITEIAYTFESLHRRNIRAGSGSRAR